MKGIEIYHLYIQITTLVACSGVDLHRAGSTQEPANQDYQTPSPHENGMFHLFYITRLCGNFFQKLCIWFMLCCIVQLRTKLFSLYPSGLLHWYKCNHKMSMIPQKIDIITKANESKTALLYCSPPGGWLDIKMSSYQYWKSRCGDKTI